MTEERILSSDELMMAVVLGVVVTMLAGGFLGAVQTGMFDTKRTVMDVGGSTETVEENAVVIEYEQLSEQQQQQFRKAATGRVVMSATNIESVEYVYLDGEYYELSKSERPTLWNWGAVASVLIVGFALFCLVSVIGGGTLLLVLAGVGKLGDWVVQTRVVQQAVQRIERTCSDWQLRVGGWCVASVATVGGGVYSSLALLARSGPVIAVREVQRSATVSASSLAPTVKNAFMHGTAQGVVVGDRLIGLSGEYIQSDGEVYAVTVVGGMDGLVLVLTSTSLTSSVWAVAIVGGFVAGGITLGVVDHTLRSLFDMGLTGA